MDHPGGRLLAGAALVVASCTLVQGSAALCSTLFDQIGSTGAASWRQLFGAAALLLFLRPRLSGRSRAEWAGIALLGAGVAVMNAAFYAAVARIPLGIAATLIYLGPCLLAMTHARRDWTRFLPALALLGVALIGWEQIRDESGGSSHPIGWLGVVCGLVAASALIVYTVASQRLGAIPGIDRAGRATRSGGLDRLALAITLSAVLLSPFAVRSAPEMPSRGWLLLVLAGAIGVALAFSCDFTALRLAGTRVVATLFALDPVVGSVIGVVALSQHLAPVTAVGIGAIVVAGALTTATPEPTRPAAA